MKKALITCLLASAPLLSHATPCSGVDRTLSEAQRRAFAPAIERHLNRQLGPQVQTPITTAPQDILQVFRVGRWHIVYVDTHVSDEPFLFYAHAPDRSSAYLTSWAGAAPSDDGPPIRRWLSRQVPGMPQTLVKCFAWHVTVDRDM